MSANGMFVRCWFCLGRGYVFGVSSTYPWECRQCEGVGFLYTWPAVDAQMAAPLVTPRRVE